MTKSEYMKKLSYSLRRLPKEDFNQAIDYFEEYFAEAGEENEQQAIEDLGSPEDAAKELIMNLRGADRTSDRTFFDLCDRSRDCFCFLCVCRLVSYGGYAGGSCGDRRDRRSGSADPKSPGWIGDIRIQSLLRRSRNYVCIWNFLFLEMASL
ncbi:Predicted membrane protein [uncultured Ruminococcus sp.]|nr:Predicted membrane protein [uncultured Ruminococcus sp.]